MRAAKGVALTLAALLYAPFARGDDTGPASGGAPTADAIEAPAAAQIDLTRDTNPSTGEGLAASREAPPPRPYEDARSSWSIGAIGFLGQFGKVAPPGIWLHTQLGYELLRWLMLYGEGELAFSDTSRTQAPPNTRAFPLFGFGAGARFTVRFTERFGVYLQGGLGAMKADIATNALGLLGFRDAESLGLYLNGRLGVEWYQIDRHFALGLNAGIRMAQGFEKTGAARDTPLALDGGASLRYAF